MQATPSQLRIALVASSLSQAGAEKQFVYAAKAWRSLGAEVHVFYLGSAAYYEAILQQAGITVDRLSSPGKPWALLAKLALRLRSFQPHVTVASQFGDIPYALAGRFARSLVVGAMRSNGHWEWRTFGRRSRWMSRLPHAIVTNSESAKQHLLARGLQSGRVHVLPNVIDLPDFDAQAARPVKFPFSRERIVAVAIGRINSDKRFDRFIQALAHARQGVPALSGLIVGADEGEQPNLERQAAARQLTPEHLVFTGPSPYVPALLSRAHMLVVTSAVEGFPNVILEAMAARLPVITTPVGDAALIVSEGFNGHLVADTPALADRLAALAQSPESSRRLGEQGRKCVEQGYAFAWLPGRLLATYRRIAAQHRRMELARLLGALEAKVQPLTGPQTDFCGSDSQYPLACTPA